MRQLLAICTLTVAILVVFAVARKNSSATVAAGGRSGQAAAPASIPGGSTDDVPTSQAIVVAGGIEARALAVKSGNPQDAVYLTSASAPNRVFLLSAASADASGSGLAPVAGTGQGGSLGDGGAALSAQVSLNLDSLIERSEMAVAPDGTIFLADTRNSTIRRIAGDATSEPGVIRSVAGHWGPRQNVSLAKPMGIALDRTGNLYIADHGTDAIDVLRAGTGQLETLAHIVSPASIAVTPGGDKVFVASPETASVYAISTESHSIQTFPGFAGGASVCSSVPPAQTGQAQVCPAGLAADSRSNLFIADVNAGQILRFDATTGNRTVTATGLDMPGDIAFDANGNLYVVEQGRSRIVEFQQMGAPSSNLTLTAPTPPVGCAQGVSFTYCNEPTGGTTQPATFIVTNSSTNTVTGLTWTLNPSAPSNFVFPSTSCLSTLSKMSSCTINVAFTPQATGLQQAMLTVADSQGDSAQEGIYGTGDDYKLQLASGQASELTVMQGGTITFQAQAVSNGVFGQNGEQVAFFCPSSSNLPAFASCVTTPCPEHIPPNSTINFQIVFVTSSASITAPLPQQSTPPGCTGYGVQPTSGLATPHAIELASNKPNQTFARTPLSPFLAMLAMMGLGAMGFIRARYHWTPALGRRAIGPVLVIFALAVGIAVTLSGCHHGSSTSSSGTPVGQTMIQIQGVAFDSQGNPLNATRDLPVITIDVVAQ